MTVATTNLSAGILMYRSRRGELEVLLVHPGGPFWRNKDDGAWSIPKGLCKEGEDPLQAAGREFEVDRAQWFSLGEARNKLLRRHVPILEALLTRLRGQD
jgi:predicted NUDIX family NTP pyrophosphohydrolase